ncbi:MAG: tRNA uridine-5-carboxymethylaminomethyl(34) synthesis GTPase MnmE [Deltaproteobacteria bacterium]|nr:tRNA uridine-5-carboxymethylaminomethyl(34) synthesis GTPase MnmE [Deltaproteobacteria bacterium]
MGHDTGRQRGDLLRLLRDYTIVVMADKTTIGALATAPAPAGIAVVRISGPATKKALRNLFRGKKDPVANPRLLVFGDLVDFKSGDIIDQALAVYMPAPFSYTGEDVGEFQFHGSPLLVQKILRSLFASGVLPAEPGEFTKRAFLNGKLDLVQAEAIADLINASSENALKIAGEQLEGRFSSSINSIGEPLRDTLAELEASIDFPEEDIDEVKLSNTKHVIAKTISEIDALLQSYSFGQVVKEGFRVLLCGPPNAGKSSILNRILGRERAIVTEVSGTTRDLIEESATLGGYNFIFCDSAGIRETSDSVEKIGIELALDRLEWADLVILVADASDEARQWEHVLPLLKGAAKKIWMVTNKIDLNPSAIGSIFCDSSTCQQNFYISARTLAGFESLTQALIDEVAHSLPSQSEASSVVTNERHRSLLSRARASLQRALEGCGNQPLELVSIDIRTALTSLEEIVGKTYTEDILGRIFSKFCIGK